MVEIVHPEKSCPQCGSANDPTAARCASCGAVIVAPTEIAALNAVDPERRVEIAHFEVDQGEQAELACGMLRANGIPCELSSSLLPGLPGERSLWVNSDDATQAKVLLDAAERAGRAKEDDAA